MCLIAAIVKLGQNGQKSAKPRAGSQMQTVSSKDAEYGFGRLIDLARAEPVAQHGRRLVVLMAIEEYERLKGIELSHLDDEPSTNGIVE